MPRAHHYRDAADWLRRTDFRLADDWRLVRAATRPGAIIGGPAADVLEGLWVSAHDDLVRAGAELVRLAHICDRRAEICSGYAADLVRYRQLGGRRTGAGSSPQPPAWWAEP